ncbi:MAG TPA: glycosyltransferase [Candidatus Saccharimonadales bacterium]|nr:glycosyltransferase [Candidatus Saccharimonadales bacterium]
MKNRLSVSIVIPVYNEERHIKACLDATMAQSVQPLEIIIVDNNCTDRTIELALQYPRVKIVKEPMQGRGAARTAGFNAARGDIIGRIDADSILTAGWIERVTQDFGDASVMGLTGLGKTNLFPRPRNLFIAFWARVYFWVTHAYFDSITMWGANMAVRRSMWLKVNQQVTLDDKLVHEDQDLSLVILGVGGKIIQDNKLLVITKGLSYFYWPKFWEYFIRSIKTKQYHERKHTVPRDSHLRIGLWRALPGAIIGWFFGVIFIIGSVVAWPVNFLLLKRN